MNLIRLIIFSLFIYIVVRLVVRMFAAMIRGKSNQVRGRPRNRTPVTNKKDIEDADYEELK